MAHFRSRRFAPCLIAPCSKPGWPCQHTRRQRRQRQAIDLLFVANEWVSPKSGLTCGSGRVEDGLKTKRQVCRALAIAAAAALLTLAASCGKKAGEDDVVASVDGRKIYRADLEKYYENQQSETEQKLSGEQATSLRLGILRQLIDNEILMRRAEKLGLLATDDEVDRKLERDQVSFHQ